MDPNSLRMLISEHFGAVLAALMHGVIASWLTWSIVRYKTSDREALGWVGLVWLSPLLGWMLYALIGINRVNRKASRILADRPASRALPPAPPVQAPRPDLSAFLDTVGPRRLTAGNRVVLLDGGDAAYDAMLDAIGAAQRSVALCTYIFDDDRVGARFVEALAGAAGRGVAVRVLVDGVGALYSRPNIVPLLQRRGVNARRFLWTPDPRRMGLLNLRNHRKILTADGRIAFAGSMNIRESFSARVHGTDAAEDLMARLEGPVVEQIQDIFALDWAFTTGERLEGADWFPGAVACGPTPARALPAGPDEDIGDTSLTWHAALSCARRRVRVLTAYFLPDDALVAALGAAARRGVAVDVIIPGASNLPFVNWATLHMLPRLLDHGVRVWMSGPPFDHSKLIVVDEDWCALGSPNWDARSLRLNFELLLEAQGPEAAAEAGALWDRRFARCSPVLAEAIRARPPLVQLRDGLILLLKPYL